MTRTAKLRPLSPTVAGVGAALKRAGFDRSSSSTTRVRGYHSTTVGFTVQRPILSGSEAIAVVGHQGKTFGAQPGDAEAALLRYAEALTKAGFRVERASYGGAPMENGPYLSVFENAHA